MNKEYILVDLDNLKIIVEETIGDVGWSYDEKKICDLTFSNLFKLNVFVSDDKAYCEWHVKSYQISDNLNLQILDLEEAFEIIKNNLDKNKEINQNLREM